MNHEKEFKAVLKTLKNNKVMVDASRPDGIYIRLAGKEGQGEAFSLEWAKVLSYQDTEIKEKVYTEEPFDDDNPNYIKSSQEEI